MNLKTLSVFVMLCGKTLLHKRLSVRILLLIAINAGGPAELIL